jgi:hypothetical protein
MTTSQETINDAARRGQTAFANALRVWADGVGKFVGSMSAPNAKAPTAEEVMNNFFHFAAQALATEREFTKRLLAATRSAATNATWAAQSVANNAATKKS